MFPHPFLARNQSASVGLAIVQCFFAVGRRHRRNRRQTLQTRRSAEIHQRIRIIRRRVFQHLVDVVIHDDKADKRVEEGFQRIVDSDRRGSSARRRRSIGGGIARRQWIFRRQFAEMQINTGSDGRSERRHVEIAGTQSESERHYRQTSQEEKRQELMWNLAIWACKRFSLVYGLFGLF